MPCQICTPNARNLVLAPSTGSGLFRTFCTISLYVSTLSDSSWAACLYNSSADCYVLSCSPGVWLQGSAPPPASSALPGPSLFASSCSASAMLWLAASRTRSRPRATMDPARGSRVARTHHTHLSTGASHGPCAQCPQAATC